jgi:hypothetical protein
MAEMVWHAKDIGAVTDFLTAAECDAYVRLSESKGFREAPITTDRGMVMMKDVRNNDRVMFDDPIARANSTRGFLLIFLRISRKNGRRSG